MSRDERILALEAARVFSLVDSLLTCGGVVWRDKREGERVRDETS